MTRRRASQTVESFWTRATEWGRPAFVGAVLIGIVWVGTGPVFAYSRKE